MSTLLEIVQKYNLKEIEERINDIETENFDINIAFLGEFSSGKSSLINALLDRKVLPTMDKPTSKRIVEIKSKDVDKIVPYKVNNQEIEPISMMDFNDLSVTAGADKIYLEVPYNDFFKKDYMIIDTPGLLSLDKMDTDITFGYLPYLDGAIICQDIQKGTLPKTLLEFLVKPEIKHILNNFIFAITKSDFKNSVARDKIREDIIKQLNSINDKNNLNIIDIESKVVLVSTKEDLALFYKSFQKNIALKRENLLEDKKGRELDKIKNDLIESLKEHKKNRDLTIDDIKVKEKQIQDKMVKIKSAKIEIEKKLDRVGISIEGDIERELKSFIPKISNLKTIEDFADEEKNLQDKIESVINHNIQKVFREDNMIISLNGKSFSFNEEITNIINKVEIGRTIGTFVFMDIIVPGSGLLGAVEGTTGVVVREMAKKSVVSTVKNGFLRGAFQIFRQINPVEYIGDFVQNKLISSKLEESIPNMSKSISFIAMDIISERINDKIDDIRDNISTQRELLENLREERNKRINEFSNYMKQVDSDISNLLIGDIS